MSCRDNKSTKKAILCKAISTGNATCFYREIRDIDLNKRSIKARKFREQWRKDRFSKLPVTSEKSDSFKSPVKRHVQQNSKYFWIFLLPMS